MEIIKFENVTKTYGNEKPVINNLNLSINRGEFVTLIGPSGCGKTTILKLINGLIKPQSGNIFVKGKEINKWNTIELRRSVGYVIQHIGLFPHMTVGENISYVLNIKNTPRSIREEKAKELIKLVRLEAEHLHKYPRELSGGQRQRVGVARALAADPDIILMDEPLGAVDEISRRALQDELLRIYNKLKKTIIFVTHDIGEATKLGTKIILFNNGKIEQEGSKEEMLFSPKTDFVKEFFGQKNFAAYLNISHVYEMCKEITEKEKKYFANRNVPFLNMNSTLMEGIRVMFDYGVERIAVKDKNGVIIGEFSLVSAYEKINNFNKNAS
ncbi:osmoprotectant ABC transporter ATP-binding protein OpuCA [Clostridium sediminicola]|uniref:ABC transporter ATP-binding protein n=1 Tax=Clostridium sediminicola TaxID=3114879 RepID=UPI0031F26BF3